ncbi:MAG: cyclase family protein [Pseudomonadota bacterium]
MRVIDLSHTLTADHPRWKPGIAIKGDVSAGDLFQVTTLTTSCHAFTHVDAGRHFFAGAATIEATPLEVVVGPCSVIDLRDVEANQEIGPELLAARFEDWREGDFALLCTGWDRHRAIDDLNFWRDAPYLSRAAAVWLRERGITTIAYDFPQDYVIRLLLDGEVRPGPEHVTHDVLLRAGVTMIEYVCNAHTIAAPRVLLSAAPLKVDGGDGAPARVYALEGPLPSLV